MWTTAFVNQNEKRINGTYLRYPFTAVAQGIVITADLFQNARWWSRDDFGADNGDDLVMDLIVPMCL